jgi:hypothetical protein
MMSLMKTFVLFAALCALTACASAPPPAPAVAYFGNLRTLCGKSYEGRLASNDPADATFAGKRLVMGPVACADADVVRIPFAVGEDRSRTWVLTRLDGDRIRLKHDHRHADGTEDVLSQYGGDSIDAGAPMRQSFPADAFSKDLFVRQNLQRSLTNVWSVDVAPGRRFAYELRRADRHFRVEFDLTAPTN